MGFGDFQEYFYDGENATTIRDGFVVKLVDEFKKVFYFDFPTLMLNDLV